MDKKNGGKINRRNFLKLAGAAAGTIGLAGLPPAVGKAFAAGKDRILIGRPLPKTGPLAAFAEPSPWLDEAAAAAINKDGGVFIKEAGKKIPVEVKIVDTSSDPSKAADVAQKLVLKDKVDIMYVSAAPVTVSPVSEVCERYGVPCVSTMMPVEMFLAGGPYKWAFCASMSVRDFLAAFSQAWQQIDTNKVVGLCAQNDADGVAWANGAVMAAKHAGFKIIDAGRFPAGTADYSTQISTWKKEGVEILFANMAPPDFTKMWRQCYQLGFIPKICTAGKAALFPSAVEAVGKEIGAGITVELAFHPSFPFKSQLTGQSAADLCKSYEEQYGKQWTQPIGGFHAGYEIIADVLKRAQTADKEALRKAFADTDLSTIAGPIKFADNHTAVTPSGCAQWIYGKQYTYESVVVSTGNYKNLKAEQKPASIRELQKK